MDTNRGQSQPHKKRLSIGQKDKNQAATLGRTTDLRIIAEAAIPRSTTELQQLVENNFKIYVHDPQLILPARPLSSTA